MTPPPLSDGWLRAWACNTKWQWPKPTSVPIRRRVQSTCRLAWNGGHHQWCRQTRNLKAKAKVEAETLKSKAIKIVLEAKAWRRGRHRWSWWSWFYMNRYFPDIAPKMTFTFPPNHLDLWPRDTKVACSASFTSCEWPPLKVWTLYDVPLSSQQWVRDRQTDGQRDGQV